MIELTTAQVDEPHLPIPSPPTTLGAGTILMIDDNPSDLAPLIAPLIEAGVNLRIAEDAMLGCSMAITHQPDLILLDINMPKVDGFTTIRLLKNAPNGQETPIIFITANNDEESRIQGLRLGAVDYIVKPFNLQEALLRIQLHLRIGQQLKQTTLTTSTAQISGEILVPTETSATLTTIDSAVNNPHNYDQALVISVTQFLRQNIANPPNVKEIAEQFGTYEKRLNHAFQNFFGCTLFVWLREERLRMAREMLLSGFVTATRISEVLGYSSPAHFNRAFREHYGCTPKTLQRQKDTQDKQQ